MTPEQKRLYDQIIAKTKAATTTESHYWIDETVWDHGAPYKVSRPNPDYGTVRIKVSNNTNDSFVNSSKVNAMAQPPAKKYRASIMVETNDLDRGSVTVQRLLSVDLAADDFDELVKAAHGALDLAKDN